MAIQEKKQKIHMIDALLSKYHELEMTALHIIVDDGNYKDSDILCCIDFAETRNEYISKQIALLLKEFSVDERTTIMKEIWTLI